MPKCKECGRTDIPDGAGWCCWCGKPIVKSRKKKTELKIPEPRQLKSGNWFIQLRIDGKSVSITEPTERACREKARAIKAGLIDHQKNLPAITLSKAIDNYIESKNNILSPSTIRGYRNIQNNRFRSSMSKDLSKMNDRQWQTVVNEEAQFVSPKTIKNAWMFISSVIVFSGFPKPVVSLPQQIAHDTPFLTPDEIDRLTDVIYGTDIEIACLLGLSSLRASEAHALRWEDIDLEKRTIHVCRSVVKDEHGVYVEKETNKNLSSNRNVPIMMDRLHEVLNAVEHKEGKVIALSMPMVRKRLEKACKSANITPVTFHGLRHSFASLAAHIDMPEAIAMQIGGWSNDKIMKRIYTHILETDVNRYQNKMSDHYNNRLQITQNANENANRI